MSKIFITHFNDVYRVTAQKFSKSSSETINVSNFGGLLNSVRAQWETRPDGKKEGLTLFSGDAFSPSMESSVTRGSHMTAILNALDIDVAVAGNHDFDYGYLHFCKLTKDSAFPWLLSNIIDENTGRVPTPLQEMQVVERGGVRIGLIGLVEKQWIDTLLSWPANFQYKDMAQVAIDLSKKLRDPNGEHKCDIILALTHCRMENDIQLAKEAYAFSPSAYGNLHSQHGVDLILGGHDHEYYVSKAITDWEGFDATQENPDSQSDTGDVLLFKSGTDFREFSDVTIELQDAPEGSVRKKIIQVVRGRSRGCVSSSSALTGSN
ncbi:Metallo-dependent phosphatase [Rhizopogon vinicolor AM-OR11-026]|uniref:Metallo-dependent phosphatase n=1 Tax=Rhizopogon vinicolor AM-OR11-026 TaxID=1314800 RepID=A0A1B7MGG5_9AGAM|nr:Metallo-dependent phosphatase [Rhizopogon vinicolor AM-OR11-026]